MALFGRKKAKKMRNLGCRKPKKTSSKQSIDAARPSLRQKKKKMRKKKNRQMLLLHFSGKPAFFQKPSTASKTAAATFSGKRTRGGKCSRFGFEIR